MAQSRWSDWRPPAPPTRASLASLYLVFGCQPYGAATECSEIHPRPFREHEAGCCAQCHGSGLDDDARLRETASDKLRLRDWEPDGGKDPWGRTVEATTYEAPRRPRDAAPTRRQARAERYGRRSVDAVSMDPRRLDRLVEDGATVMA